MEYIKLSLYGYSEKYYISESGVIFKDVDTIKEVKRGKDNIIRIKDKENKSIRISYKKLYRQVFNKEYCIDNIKNLNGEEWKEISGTNGKYYISNYGRVKSYCGYTARLMIPQERKNGYLSVQINGKHKKIHRLVATAFCENKYNEQEKIEIHHLDTNKKNNNYKNLTILSIAEHRKIHSNKGKNNT